MIRAGEANDTQETGEEEHSTEHEPESAGRDGQATAGEGCGHRDEADEEQLT